ncbi:MAG: sensor N-terminal transmembrane domain-containing protein, partial [Pseudomonadota bacterium]
MNAPSDPARDIATSPSRSAQPEAALEDTPVARGGERLSVTGRFALTARILIVNILPLALLGGGLFYLDSYRTQLINERYKLARIEAQITAEALAGARRERQEALLIQIGKEQRMRLRMFDEEGELIADSFALDEP